MALRVGDRVEEKAHSTERLGRTGVICEIVGTTPVPRYRIRWDDGRESVFTPAAGSLDKLPAHAAPRSEPRTRTPRRAKT